jgi:hypothetical protein
MNKATKILLAISLTSFLASLTGALWGLFLPLGAVSLGLFMIFNLLGKETELFDEEQRTRVATTNLMEVCYENLREQKPEFRVAQAGSKICA